jgi:lysozyme family protein
MANLQQALEKTLRFEGGYANVTGDTGGETYCGIARNHWPKAGIWPIIDKCNKQRPLKRGAFVTGPDNEKLKPLISDFYRIQFWDDIRGNDIKSQSVANYLFDWHVTSGSIAVRQLQDILGVDSDGKVGNLTLAAINAADPHKLFDQMVANRVQRAKDRAAHIPSQQKFLKGWLNRFEGFQFEG